MGTSSRVRIIQDQSAESESLRNIQQNQNHPGSISRIRIIQKNQKHPAQSESSSRSRIIQKNQDDPELPSRIRLMQTHQALVKMWADFIRKGFTQLKKNNFVFGTFSSEEKKTKTNV